MVPKLVGHNSKNRFFRCCDKFTISAKNHCYDLKEIKVKSPVIIEGSGSF